MQVKYFNYLAYMVLYIHLCTPIHKSSQSPWLGTKKLIIMNNNYLHLYNTFTVQHTSHQLSSPPDNNTVTNWVSIKSQLSSLRAGASLMPHLLKGVDNQVALNRWVTNLNKTETIIKKYDHIQCSSLDQQFSYASI